MKVGSRTKEDTSQVFVKLATTRQVENVSKQRVSSKQAYFIQSESKDLSLDSASSYKVHDVIEISSKLHQNKENKKLF